MSIDSNSLPDSFRRAMVREPALRQPEGRFGNCYDCGAPFMDKYAGIYWRIGTRDVDLCGTCNDRRLKVSPQKPTKQPRRAPESTASASEGQKGAVTAEEPASVKFTIPGNPVGKPRMTQRDKWAKRPCVMRYRTWADKARAASGVLPDNPERVWMEAYFEMPKSWSRRKREAMRGKTHRQKPDADNICKCLDALFADDAGISSLCITKMWDDGGGARLEVEVS